MKKISRRQFLMAAGAASAAGLLSACGDSSSTVGSSSVAGSASGEMPTVVITYMLPTIPVDNQMVSDAISAYTEEKLGIRVELAPIVSSDYANQLNLIVAGDEHYDIAYVRDLSSFVASGAVLDITDLMDTFGQGALEALGVYADAGKIGGRLYTLAPIRNMPAQPGYMIRKDLAEKYNLDFSGVKTEADLTPIFAQLKELEPNMSMVASETIANPFWVENFDPLGDYFGVLLDYAETLEITDLFASDYFVNTCKLHREWFQAGYIPSDVLTASEASQDMIRAGTLAGYTCSLKPGIEQEKLAKTGYDMITVPLADPFVAASRLSSGYGILHNSPNPEAAAQVLNLMFSDSEFINLIDWGIEGVHYEMVEGEDNLITFPEGVDAGSCGYYHTMNWLLGNQLLSYVALPETSDLWDRMKEFNDQGRISAAFGFMYDSSSVRNEYTACKNVYDKYVVALTNGAIDIDENLPKLQAEMETAGLAKIIEVKQQQLNDWAGV